MTQLAGIISIDLERTQALADLIRAVAAAPDAREVARHAVTALQRSYPSATAVFVHELSAETNQLVPIATDLDLSRLSVLHREEGAVLDPLDRAIRERRGLTILMPEALLAVAPVEHGDRCLGTLALTLPASADWDEADASWLSLLAQPVGLALVQARLQEERRAAEQRFRAMSEEVESRAQVRVEQMAGRGRQLEALFQLSTQISRTLDETRVSAMALDHLIALTQSRFGFVAMLSPGGALELGCLRPEQGEGCGVKRAGSDSAYPTSFALYPSPFTLVGGLRELVESVVHGGTSLRRNEGVGFAGVSDQDRSELTPDPWTRPTPTAGVGAPPVLAVPLTSGNRCLGALVLVGRMPGYDEADERLVAMFGLQVAVAVQNARMVGKIESSLQTRRRELTSLSRTAQQLATTADEDQVLERVVTILRKTFEARAAWVMLLEGDGVDGSSKRKSKSRSDLTLPPTWERIDTGPGARRLRMRQYQGEGAAGLWSDSVVPENEGLVAEALRTSGPVFGRSDLPVGALRSTTEATEVHRGHAANRSSGQESDLTNSPNSVPSVAGPRALRGTSEAVPHPQWILWVPLVVHEQVLGVVGIDSARFTERRPPRPQDLDLIQAFTSQAAVAIENARLMGAAHRRTRREQLLNAIMDAVREPTEVESILDRAVERLGAALEVSRCIALLPQENGEYQEHAWTEPEYPIPPDEILWESCPIVQCLEETGEPLAIADYAAWIADCRNRDRVRGQDRQDRSRPGPFLSDASSCSSCPSLLNPSGDPKSVLAVPALRGGRPVALFLFHQCDRSREWTEDDLSLAQRVASQVAVAVVNAHLYEQELEQEKFLRSMAEIAQAVGSSVELTQVLRAVGEHGMRLLDADAAYIWRLDEAGRELVSAAAVGHKANRFQGMRLSLARRGSTSHVVRAALEGRAILANGVGLDRKATQRLVRIFDCQSLLAVPLLVRGNVFGVVLFSATDSDTRFDEEDQSRAEVLVSQAAAAIENAQLYEAERDRAEELEVLWRIGQEIAENLQPERIYQSIVDGARRILGVDAVSLMMFAEDGQTLTVTEQEGLSAGHVGAIRFRRGGRIPSCLAVDGAHHVTANLSQDPHYPPVAAQDGLQSMLSVPMLDGTQIAGALNVYSSRRRHFRIEEAQQLALLASFAMTTLRQARQFQREHEIAKAFQRDLLPELKLDVVGFDVARKSIAALTSEADVGGDFYDIHRVSESKVGFVIGDVSGKGLAAAPEMAMVKCVLRAFAFESASPAQVLERLNRLLSRTMEPERFVTLFYGVLDIEKGVLTYANAGHELPLVLRRGSGEPELLETTGPLLGLDRESRYRQVCSLIGTGDTLVLYTDGFTDARRDDRFLQVEGLASLLGDLREETAMEMVESVSQSVTDFSGGRLNDDATILVVKSTG